MIGHDRTMMLVSNQSFLSVAADDQQKTGQCRHRAVVIWAGPCQPAPSGSAAGFQRSPARDGVCSGGRGGGEKKETGQSQASGRFQASLP